MRTLILAIGLFLTGCSGSKEDSHLAFTAIFQQPRDAAISVQRGKIWENRHLFIFYEYYALVEFDASEAKVQELLAGTQKKFQKFDASDFGFGLKEDELWFAPRDGSRYLGWRSEDGGMYVVRSSKTQRFFAMRSEL